MTELSRQLELIEVPNPGRIIFRRAPLELADRLGEGVIAAFPVARPGQGACLHGVKMRDESGGGYALRSCLGSAREVGCLAEAAEIGRLMAHRVQDARTEQPVISGLRERECLNEVPLSERAGGHAVVAHPGGEKGRLGHRRDTAPGLWFRCTARVAVAPRRC